MDDSTTPPRRDYSTLPEDLKPYRAFLVWEKQTKIVDGITKTTKVPIIAATGALASSTDSLTWTSFDDAVAAYNAGKGDGVGYVVSSGDPFVFIDLDKGIDADERARLLTEGTDDRFAGLKSWAGFVRDVAPFAYVALSQSGTGLHLIMRGKLPGPGGKKPVLRNDVPVGAIEMYDEKRFVALTGVTL